MFRKPQLYSDASFLQQRKAERMFTKYASWLRCSPHDLVLDIGSGPAIITKRLPEFLPAFQKIVGVDASQEMVDHARKKCSDKRLFFYKMDITESSPDQLRMNLSPELKNTKFDKVFCLYLLHWLAEKFQQALINVESLMASGGQGMAIQYTSIPVFDAYTIVGKYNKWAPFLKGKILDYNPLRLAKDPSEFMRSSMTDAGLKVDDITTYSDHNVYHKKSDLVELMTSIDPFLPFIPTEMQAEYQEDFFNYLLPRCPIGNDGSIGVPFTVMTVAFSKSN